MRNEKTMYSYKLEACKRSFVCIEANILDVETDLGQNPDPTTRQTYLKPKPCVVWEQGM